MAISRNHYGTRSAWRRVAPVLAFAVFTSAGGVVDADLPAYRPLLMVSGVIRCAGADNLDGIVQRWSREFANVQPGARVEVDTRPKLSSEGVQALVDGRAQIAPLARELFPSELARLRRHFGHEPLVVCVAIGSYDTPHNTDALAIYVNAANPLPSLTLAQLDAIFSASRQRGGAARLTTWGQLGLAGAWATRPIHAYGMVRLRPSGDPPGIVNFLAQRLLLGGEFDPRVRTVRDAAGVPALDGIVQRVAADPDAIGYSGFANGRPGVRALAVAEAAGAPAVAGTAATVAADTYPLTRHVYLCLDRAPGRPLPPLSAEFLRFALSREGQAAVAADPSGYLPLSAARAAAEMARLE